MKNIFAILFFTISFSCLAQDEWVEFKNLPDTIRVQVDSIHFKNALKLIEGGYLVETGIKRNSTDTLYSNDGQILNISHFKSGGSIAGWIVFIAIVAYLTFMISGH
jgi:hypothetical protein